MAKLIYPLKQILEIKQRRVEEAERVVQEKRDLLRQEVDKLKQRQQERDKVKDHHNAKLNQMREELDHGTTSPVIQQMKAYLKIVKERLQQEEKKVNDQKEQVKIADKNLELAITDLKFKRQEVDKLVTHREDWEKEMRKEEEIIEGREQDELGSITFMIHKKLKF